MAGRLVGEDLAKVEAAHAALDRRLSCALLRGREVGADPARRDRDPVRTAPDAVEDGGPVVLHVDAEAPVRFDPTVLADHPARRGHDVVAEDPVAGVRWREGARAATEREGAEGGLDLTGREQVRPDELPGGGRPPLAIPGSGRPCLD